MSWYIHGLSGVKLWWCGTIEKVLAKRSDQQWSIRFKEATAYADVADAVAAAAILDDLGNLAIVEIDLPSSLPEILQLR